MDRKQLENKINQEFYTFREESDKRGYPIRDICLVPFEAWREMYNIEVYADWVETMDCSDALELLTDVMFDTMSEESRSNIFIIKILDKDDVVHCVDESPFVEMVTA